MKTIYLSNKIKTSTKRRCILLLLIAWLLLIFCLSNEPQRKTTHTTNTFNKTVFTVINTCIGNVFSKEDIQKLSTDLFLYTRKCAHIFLYFVLTILLFSYIKQFPKQNSKITFTILLSVLFACLDEIHQLWVQGREGSILDVAVDLVGIILGISACYFLWIKKNSIR